MPQFLTPLILISLLFSGVSLAQDIRYVSDKQFVALRSGASDEHSVVARGIASGTRLTIAGTTGDGDWVEVTTDKGQSGWIRSHYLMSEVPAQQRLAAITQQMDETGKEGTDPNAQIQKLQIEREDLLLQITALDTELDTTRQELHHLTQISGNAVQMDTTNRQLVEEAENLRSELEMLQAESQRLTSKLENEDFINGALAVLLGVIIALVAPRLVPNRRKTSSW